MGATAFKYTYSEEDVDFRINQDNLSGKVM